ncbi:MAG: YkgJ family cysteine cluster protein [Planctomycetota bacterium]|nr:MAG: YkgJ family cysteine cluster protein [Planctomycetota bacterium]
MSKPRVRREDLKPGEVLCEYCTARCCQYFAFPIEKPKTWSDFDHIRWYLMHGNCAVFVDDGTWYILIYSPCQHLLPDNRCGIYEHRPQVCRDYSTDDCEYDNDACYDQFFETPEQIWEYAEAILPERKQPVWNRPRRYDPLRLPVL